MIKEKYVFKPKAKNDEYTRYRFEINENKDGQKVYDCLKYIYYRNFLSYRGCGSSFKSVKNAQIDADRNERLRIKFDFGFTHTSCIEEEGLEVIVVGENIKWIQNTYK